MTSHDQVMTEYDQKVIRNNKVEKLAVLFCSFFFLTFFYLLAGFILFIVLPLYSFARCWVKGIFIFAYKGFEERIIG